MSEIWLWIIFGSATLAGCLWIAVFVGWAITDEGAEIDYIEMIPVGDGQFVPVLHFKKRTPAALPGSGPG